MAGIPTTSGEWFTHGKNAWRYTGNGQFLQRYDISRRKFQGNFAASNPTRRAVEKATGRFFSRTSATQKVKQAARKTPAKGRSPISIGSRKPVINKPKPKVVPVERKTPVLQPVKRTLIPKDDAVPVNPVNTVQTSPGIQTTLTKILETVSTAQPTFTASVGAAPVAEPSSSMPEKKGIPWEQIGIGLGILTALKTLKII